MMNELTAAQAQYVLDRLIAEKKVSRRDIDRYLGSLGSEVRALEERLQALRNLAGRSGSQRAPRSAQPGSSRKRQSRPRKAKRATTPEVAASRQLQGRYIAALRQLSARDRARISKIAQSEGREAALKAMQR